MFTPSQAAGKKSWRRRRVHRQHWDDFSVASLCEHQEDEEEKEKKEEEEEEVEIEEEVEVEVEEDEDEED